MSEEVLQTETAEKVAVLPEENENKTKKKGENKACAVLLKILNGIGGVLLFVVLGIPMLLLALVKFFEDFHNPFYVSSRTGENGKEFKYFKIRTMCICADELEKQLIEAGLNEAELPKFKMENDPRITKVGQYYRRYRIDRLPALMNVIAGQLTLKDVFKKH